MGIEAPAKVKYGIINEAAAHDNNLLNITMLCRIAGVSRSGYYEWLKSAEYRQACEEQDARDFELVLGAYRYRGRAKGARSIYMRLLHTGIRMNLKKIRRLMRKFGLKCPVRGANPYRRMAKALKTNSVFPNVVNREFHKGGPRHILLTDITYLFFVNGKSYLSTILDAVTREVLAYRVSMSLDVTFVLETLDELQSKHGAVLDNTTIVHSDQGCHYTSRAFIEKLKELEFVQSMSRKGNCWDNAPQESFFGHFKDEVRDWISNCKTFEEVRAAVDDQMDYYNNDRYQWELVKLSPREYYEYLKTGIYPLEPYCSET